MPLQERVTNHASLLLCHKKRTIIARQKSGYRMNTKLPSQIPRYLQRKTLRRIGIHPHRKSDRNDALKISLRSSPNQNPIFHRLTDSRSQLTCSPCHSLSQASSHLIPYSPNLLPKKPLVAGRQQEKQRQRLSVAGAKLWSKLLKLKSNEQSSCTNIVIRRMCSNKKASCFRN